MTCGLAVMMLDGLEIADRTHVVALGITTEGQKIPLGLWEGSTENATLARTLHADAPVPVLGVDVRRTPNPLRPRLCARRRGLSRPRHARSAAGAGDERGSSRRREQLSNVVDEMA
jgi:hypothetical protein